MAVAFGIASQYADLQHNNLLDREAKRKSPYHVGSENARSTGYTVVKYIRHTALRFGSQPSCRVPASDRQGRKRRVSFRRSSAGC